MRGKIWVWERHAKRSWTEYPGNNVYGKGLTWATGTEGATF